MSRATTSPSEALAQLIAECKQIDASEVGERWNQFSAAIAVAEMVLRDYVAPEPVAYMAFASNGNVRIWAAKNNRGAKEAAEKNGMVLQPVYANPVAAQPAAAPASDDLREGRTMLDDLIASITKHGNYSQESTLAFLNQLRQCLAAPLHESGSAAPIAWISPHLLESLASHRENAKVPSNWSVAVQAAQRNSEDIPLYLNPQGEN